MSAGRLRSLALLGLLTSVPLRAGAAMPIFPDAAPPEAFGRVVLDSTSRGAGVPPVVFEHWRHRALYSCRLCHVDVGFAMERGASGITRATNASKLHCGACHNGKTTNRAKPIFAACSESGEFDPPTCSRCHVGRGAARQQLRYQDFIQGLPVFAGGYVDWDIAEARGDVVPIDYVEGLSIPRGKLKIDQDVPLTAKGTFLGNVLFSHKRHVAWNGCEVCHPEIFPSTKRGSAKFTMADINAGKYCGVCHLNVAFPLAECQRCHASGPGAPFGGRAQAER